MSGTLVDPEDQDLLRPCEPDDEHEHVKGQALSLDAELSR